MQRHRPAPPLRRRAFLLASAMLPLGFAACGGGGDAAVAFQASVYGAWLPEGTAVYRSRAALEEAQRAAWNGTPDGAYGPPGPPAAMPVYPAVDFSSQIVVAVSAGLLNTCQRLLIESVERSDAGLVVRYRRDPPGGLPTLVCGVISRPFAVMATVDATDASVRFLRTDV